MSTYDEADSGQGTYAGPSEVSPQQRTIIEVGSEAEDGSSVVWQGPLEADFVSHVLQLHIGQVLWVVKQKLVIHDMLFSFIL